MPWRVDQLQQDPKILGAVFENNPGTPFRHRCAEKGRGGKHVPKDGGGERDYRRVDPENCLPAQYLYVSILQVECLVASGDPFAAALLNIFIKFGRSPVGYRGDTRRGGAYGANPTVGGCSGRSLGVI